MSYKLNGPSNWIEDAAANPLLKFSATGSAVNYLQLANSAAGNSPVLSPVGSDSAIGLVITPKGTGGLVLTSGGFTVTAGGILVTAGGAVITAGGLQVTAGGIVIGGAAGGAGSAQRLVKTVTAIPDATATALLTVTVPNAAHAAVLRLTILGSLGAGGAIGAFEASATLDGSIVIARTAGLATVATAATATLTASSAVAGATTITLAYDVSGLTGANGATQTFTVRATVTKGGGSSANHQVVVVAEVLNNQTAGITVA